MYAKAQKWEPKWLFKGGGNWDRGCLVERLRLDRSPGSECSEVCSLSHQKTVTTHR